MSQFSQGGWGDDLFGSPYVLGIPVPTRGVGSARSKISGLITVTCYSAGGSTAHADSLRTRLVAGTSSSSSTATAAAVRRKLLGGTAGSTSAATADALRRRGLLGTSTGIGHGRLSPLTRTSGTGIMHGTSHSTAALFKIALPPPVSGMRIAPWSRRTLAADLRFQGWTARV